MCERIKAVSINNANSNGDKKSKGSTKSDTKVTIKELRKDLLIKTLNKFNKNLDIMISNINMKSICHMLMHYVE